MSTDYCYHPFYILSDVYYVQYYTTQFYFLVMISCTSCSMLLPSPFTTWVESFSQPWGYCMSHRPKLISKNAGPGLTGLLIGNCPWQLCPQTWQQRCWTKEETCSYNIVHTASMHRTGALNFQVWQTWSAGKSMVPGSWKTPAALHGFPGLGL